METQGMKSAATAMAAAQIHYHVVEPKITRGSRIPADITFVDMKAIVAPSFNEDGGVDNVEEAPTPNTASRVNRLYRCEKCQKVFASRDSCLRHIVTHGHENEAKIGRAEARVSRNDARAGVNLTCDQCRKNFSRVGTLKRHVQQVHNKDEQSNASKSEFYDKFERRDGFLVCDSCPYRAHEIQKHRMVEHYRIHTGERPYICAACGKSSRTKSMLKKHLATVHENVREFVCDMCGRCFTERRYMEEHKRIHTGERPYVCDLCGKTFAHAASLFVHKNLHKNERKHCCAVCGERFNTNSVLKKHMRRHNGERNYKCDLCDKAFTDSQVLKCHKTVHSEERPFKCDKCDSRFKLRKHLKQHDRTHNKG